MFSQNILFITLFPLLFFGCARFTVSTSESYDLAAGYNKSLDARIVSQSTRSAGLSLVVDQGCSSIEGELVSSTATRIRQRVYSSRKWPRYRYRTLYEDTYRFMIPQSYEWAPGFQWTPSALVADYEFWGKVRRQNVDAETLTLTTGDPVQLRSTPPEACHEWNLDREFATSLSPPPKYDILESVPLRIEGDGKVWETTVGEGFSVRHSSLGSWTYAVSMPSRQQVLDTRVTAKVIADSSAPDSKEPAFKGYEDESTGRITYMWERKKGAKGYSVRTYRSLTSPKPYEDVLLDADEFSYPTLLPVGRTFYFSVRARIDGCHGEEWTEESKRLRFTVPEP